MSNAIQGRLGTIAGGAHNVSTGVGAFIGGGFLNSATGDTSAVGGGSLNQANALNSTIAGGRDNYITPAANRSFIGGGQGNYCSGPGGSIGGGTSNVTGPGIEASVPGGVQNIAQGDYSFAAGFQAQALHNCSFVWNDCCGVGTPSQAFKSITPNSFNARATGGFYFATSCDTLNAAGIGTGAYLAPGASMWSVLSDRRAKRDIRAIDPDDILRRVAKLQIARWSYKAQDYGIDHIGPMAQDFYQQFKLGESNTRISSLDPSGVALAAIQALNKKTEQLEQSQGRIKDLEKEVAQLKSMVETIMAEQARKGQ